MPFGTPRNHALRVECKTTPRDSEFPAFLIVKLELPRFRE